MDLVIVGSGVGGLTAALVGRSPGLEPLILEKSGVEDSVDDAVRYLDAVVGDAGPSTTPQRRRAYVEQARKMVGYLQGEGIEFVYCRSGAGVNR